MARRLEAADIGKSPVRARSAGGATPADVVEERPAPKWYAPFLLVILVLSVGCLCALFFVDADGDEALALRADAAEQALAEARAASFAETDDADLTAMVADATNAASRAVELQNALIDFSAGDPGFDDAISELQGIFSGDPDAAVPWEGPTESLGGTWSAQFGASTDGGRLGALWLCTADDGEPIAFARAEWGPSSSSFASCVRGVSARARVEATPTRDAGETGRTSDAEAQGVADLVEGLEFLMAEWGDPPVLSEEAARKIGEARGEAQAAREGSQSQEGDTGDADGSGDGVSPDGSGVDAREGGEEL